MASDRRPEPSAAGKSVAVTGSPVDSLLAFADALLARAPEPDAVVELGCYLTFCLCGEDFGLPILRSCEIVRLTEITRIPEAPAHVRGVINLRGRVLPVVDLRTRFGLSAAPLTPQSRAIVVEAYGRRFGLLVDRVSGIVKIPAGGIKPAPTEALFGNPDFVSGLAPMGADSMILLDVDQVLLLDTTVPARTIVRAERA